MRAGTVLMVLGALLVAGMPVSGDGALLSLCEGVVIDPSAPGTLFEAGCPSGAIRPGAWGHGCTFDFVVSDGTDLYIGTAGHCGGVGKRWATPGVGEFGTTVVSEVNYNDVLSWRDWALIRIDADHHDVVDATMLRFAGPYAVAPGVLARPPVPGEAVFQYGHGAGFGQEDATRGRVGTIIAPLGTTAFLYAGLVGGGDSGSPVRFASGEAAGIAVAYAGFATGDNQGYVEGRCAAVDGITGAPVPACVAWDTICPHLDGACAAPFRPGSAGPIVIATRMDAALAAFEEALGRDLFLVAGDLPHVGLG